MNTFGLPTSPLYDTFVFPGNSPSAGGTWAAWRKPKGRSMASIFLLGAGGGGGTGVIGANSTAGGGGGGASGCQTVVNIPLVFLPEMLFLSIGMGSTGSGVASYVAIEPNNSRVNSIIAHAAGGGAGGNGSGASNGPGGVSGSITNASLMPLGWPFVQIVLGGQDGVAGSGASQTFPTTGLRVSSGTGGGPLGAAASVGTAGGTLTVPSAPSPFPAQAGGLQVNSATTPAGNGSNGFTVYQCGLVFYGGTGGSATHGSATGAGLVQGSGGDGGIGCGGGGMGGALTASTPGVQSKGGSGLCIITCW